MRKAIRESPSSRENYSYSFSFLDQVFIFAWSFSFLINFFKKIPPFFYCFPVFFPTIMQSANILSGGLTL